jgi:hypothetical protein
LEYASALEDWWGFKVLKRKKKKRRKKIGVEGGKRAVQQRLHLRLSESNPLDRYVLPIHGARQAVYLFCAAV